MYYILITNDNYTLCHNNVTGALTIRKADHIPTNERQYRHHNINVITAVNCGGFCFGIDFQVQIIKQQ